jgi:hypothetical protein
MISNEDYSNVWGIKLRESPVVQVMSESTTSSLELQLCGNSSVQEHFNHVENVESLLGGLGEHGLENELLSLHIVAFDHVIEAVCSVDYFIALSEDLVVLVGDNSTFVFCKLFPLFFIVGLKVDNL